MRPPPVRWHSRAVTRHFQNDDVGWDAGREGYVDVPRAAKYTPVAKAAKPTSQSSSLSIRGQERAASLMAAAGMVWAVYVATTDYASLMRLQVMPPGPVEVCGLGILLWLHAKWRRSLKSL
jgi:hypothetical protein